MEEEGLGVSYVARSGDCQWRWGSEKKETAGTAPGSQLPLPTSGHREMEGSPHIPPEPQAHISPNTTVSGISGRPQVHGGIGQWSPTAVLIAGGGGGGDFCRQGPALPIWSWGLEQGGGEGSYKQGTLRGSRPKGGRPPTRSHHTLELPLPRARKPRLDLLCWPTCPGLWFALPGGLGRGESGNEARMRKLGG